MDEFEKDLARAIEIAKQRVAMFDADDESFRSKESGKLFKEYRALRNKYPHSQSEKLYAAYHHVWETQ